MLGWLLDLGQGLIDLNDQLPAYDNQYEDGGAGDKLESSPVANKIRRQTHEAFTESEYDLV